MPDTVFLWLFAVGGIAALAADPGVMAKSGRAFKVADLAVEYGFTDPGTDGGGGSPASPALQRSVHGPEMRGLRKGQQRAIGGHQRSVETAGGRREDTVHGVGQDCA